MDLGRRRSLVAEGRVIVFGKGSSMGGLSMALMEITQMGENRAQSQTVVGRARSSAPFGSRMDQP